jgi:hypothetical protein
MMDCNINANLILPKGELYLLAGLVIAFGK